MYTVVRIINKQYGGIFMYSRHKKAFSLFFMFVLLLSTAFSAGAVSIEAPDSCSSPEQSKTASDSADVLAEYIESEVIPNYTPSPSHSPEDIAAYMEQVLTDGASEPQPKYTPCPVGSGPCVKGAYLYFAPVYDNKGTHLYDIYFYGCNMCRTIYSHEIKNKD